MEEIGHSDDLKDMSFFSISDKLVILERPITYDLYINSSKRKGKEKYVRIFPMGEILEKERLEQFVKKYIRLYIREEQRDAYLKGMIGVRGDFAIEKTKVIKDSAITYLDRLFEKNQEFSTELLQENIKACREVVESMVEVIQDVHVNELQDMIGELSFHDFYTYDHSVNVSMYCISFYKYIYPEATRQDIIMAGLGGLLHDLGKLKIPTYLINKASPLTSDEFNEIKKHPVYGEELLGQKSIDIEGVDLEIISRVVNEHHENFNGTGYPAKLKGEKIHLLARICAIADFFDAITTKRSYHEALDTQDAINLMAKSSGVKIDPHLFELFTEAVKKMPKSKLMNKTVKENYDPCQPHETLETEEVKVEEKAADFGKIRVKN